MSGEHKADEDIGWFRSLYILHMACKEKLGRPRIQRYVVGLNQTYPRRVLERKGATAHNQAATILR